MQTWPRWPADRKSIAPCTIAQSAVENRLLFTDGVSTPNRDSFTAVTCRRDSGVQFPPCNPVAHEHWRRRETGVSSACVESDAETSDDRRGPLHPTGG